MWELWSPNLSVHAYFPGIRDRDANLGTELQPHLRRSDGHLGRFDYTTSPQYYSDERPWLGFIKTRRDDASVENASIFNVWVPEEPPN